MHSGAESIVFNTGEPAYAVNRGGQIVAWNKAATSTFGYPEASALGADCWQLFRGKDIYNNQYCGEHCPHREMALRHEAINRCQLKLRLASGKYADFTVSTISLFDEPGREYLIHLCSQDVQQNGGNGAPKPAREASSAPGLLTRRELEVLTNLTEGHSTRDIATIMSISIPTVRNHIEHILHKLHCHSRLEAVAVARRLDLI